MRFLFFITLLLATSIQLHAGPAPYSSAKIYIIESGTQRLDASGKLHDLTPQEIRDSADIKMEIGPAVIVNWFYSLNWNDAATHDPTVKQWAKPLVMIIDLYHRGQPDPPAKPMFDTLYCTAKYAYSEKGYYMNITPFSSKGLKLPIINSP